MPYTFYSHVQPLLRFSDWTKIAKILLPVGIITELFFSFGVFSKNLSIHYPVFKYCVMQHSGCQVWLIGGQQSVKSVGAYVPFWPVNFYTATARFIYLLIFLSVIVAVFFAATINILPKARVPKIFNE